MNKFITIVVLIYFLFGVNQSIAAEEYVIPKEEFLNSIVLVRPGVDDLGGASVSMLKVVIEKSKMDNKNSPTVKGWKKVSSGYELHVVGAKPYQLNFIWSGGNSSLLKPIMMGNETIPAMLYIMHLTN